MWVRGLKLTGEGFKDNELRVAPYVGAWIETRPTTSLPSPLTSHPMWVRGLKRRRAYTGSAACRRTLCGCVD